MNHIDAPLSEEGEDNEDSIKWAVEVWEDSNGRSPFTKWYDKLDDYDQAVVDTAITKVLEPIGMDIAGTEWGKALGGGLYEFRIRLSLSTLLHWGETQAQDDPPWKDRKVLLRIFCTFHGDRIVLLFQGYDKGKDPSEKRQQKEIKKARKNLREWQHRA